MDVTQTNNDLSSIGKTDAAPLIPADGLAATPINAIGGLTPNQLNAPIVTPVSTNGNLSDFKPADPYSFSIAGDLFFNDGKGSINLSLL